MDYINWSRDAYQRKKIEAILKLYGLRYDTSEAWEVHSLPEGRQVYVGYAFSTETSGDVFCVVVWPDHDVYEIDNPSRWQKTEPTRKFARKEF
jgi:hypothetical protein